MGDPHAAAHLRARGRPRRDTARARAGRGAARRLARRADLQAAAARGAAVLERPGGARARLRALDPPGAAAAVGRRAVLRRHPRCTLRLGARRRGHRGQRRGADDHDQAAAAQRRLRQRARDAVRGTRPVGDALREPVEPAASRRRAIPDRALGPALADARAPRAGRPARSGPGPRPRAARDGRRPPRRAGARAAHRRPLPRARHAVDVLRLPQPSPRSVQPPRGPPGSAPRARPRRGGAALRRAVPPRVHVPPAGDPRPRRARVPGAAARRRSADGA